MNYQECVEFLYSQLPFYQKGGRKALKYNLDHITAICERLGNPQLKFESIHVAGTNGKGSSCHAIASVLQAHGIKTGLYTSPHLKDYRERIRVNGRPVVREFIVKFLSTYRSLIEDLNPSFFEITVAMAFEYFAINSVELAVIEVGMGGRLDSTNIIKPLVSLITNIGYDHQAVLGNTLAEIAREKAGIIKHGIPVVVGERQPETDKVFSEIATKMNSEYLQARDNFKIRVLETTPKMVMQVFYQGTLRWNELTMDLNGPYQVRNVPGILQTLDKLGAAGFILDDSVVAKGLATIVKSTGLLGRWQQLGQHPLILCDTGHNTEAMEYIVTRLVNLNQARLHMVLGISKDKNHTEMLGIMPRDASYYFCSSSVARVLEAKKLQLMAESLGLKGVAIDDPIKALGRAKTAAAPDDLIFVGGSSFVVADILNSYEKKAGKV